MHRPKAHRDRRDTHTTIQPLVARDYLGAAKRYYEPTEQGVERKIKERVEKWRETLAGPRLT